MRLLVIEHEPDSGMGLLADRARSRGSTLDTRTPATGIPRTADGCDGVIALGATPSVNDVDTLPWIADELALLGDAVRHAIPVLGICFGAQALAVALGGSVAPAARPEIGWMTVDTDDPDLVPPGPWMQWHVDAIGAPPNARVLARSATCVQAFTAGPHLAVQFHPEVTIDIVESWAATGAEQAAAAGCDTAQLLSTTRAVAGGARQRADALFDHYLERVVTVRAARNRAHNGGQPPIVGPWDDVLKGEGGPGQR